jgi:hypothetical protein
MARETEAQAEARPLLAIEKTRLTAGFAFRLRFALSLARLGPVLRRAFRDNINGALKARPCVLM